MESITSFNQKIIFGRVNLLIFLKFFIRIKETPEIEPLKYKLTSKGYSIATDYESQLKVES